MASKTVQTFSLDTDTDADLVRWLKGLPSGARSAKIRDVLRAGLNMSPRDVITLDVIYQLLQDMQAHGYVAVPDTVSAGTGKESSEAAAALGNLIQQGRA